MKLNGPAAARFFAQPEPGRAGLLIHGADASLQHVMRMVEESALISINGKRIPVNPQSICVHGDNADAAATAQAIRDGLQKAGYQMATIPDLASA